MNLSEQQLAEYRALIGVQLQFAEEGDMHVVMKMQLQLEEWIATLIAAQVAMSLRGIGKGFYSIENKLSENTLTLYRLKQGRAMQIFSEYGFGDQWKEYQATIERWIGEIVDEEIINVSKRFIKIK